MQNGSPHTDAVKNITDNAPLVTIVIPTYNRVQLLMEAIRSVIAQTYPLWELIIVDDGSTDGTTEAVRKIADPRIRMISLPHKGTARTLRNTGVRAGKGDWICFLDSDDLWLPEKLERQLYALQQSSRECCYSNVDLINKKGEIIPAKAGSFRPLNGRIIYELLRNEATVTIISLMISRRVFNLLNGFSEDPSLQREDYEFELRLALKEDMIAVPEVLALVRHHKGRSTNLWSVADAHLHSAMPYKLFIGQNPGIELEKLATQRFRYHTRQAAKFNFKTGRYRSALQQLKNSLARIK